MIQQTCSSFFSVHAGSTLVVLEFLSCRADAAFLIAAIGHLRLLPLLRVTIIARRDAQREEDQNGKNSEHADRIAVPRANDGLRRGHRECRRRGRLKRIA